MTDEQASGADGASLAGVLGACARLDEHHLSLIGIPAMNWSRTCVR
jgi:hypothetical protein